MTSKHLGTTKSTIPMHFYNFSVRFRSCFAQFGAKFYRDALLLISFFHFRDEHHEHTFTQHDTAGELNKLERWQIYQWRGEGCREKGKGISRSQGYHNRGNIISLIT